MIKRVRHGYISAVVDHISENFFLVGVALVFIAAILAPSSAFAASIFSTPGTRTFVVPVGVTEITVKAWGAGGGSGGGNGAASGYGGGGGFAQRTFSVTSGETLTIAVGDSGKGGSTLSNIAGAGGAPGGAPGASYAGCQNAILCSTGGGGGGYSGVFRGTVSQAGALLIAGGGGGSGGTGNYAYASNGGAGGGSSGVNSSFVEQHGFGGTQLAGGSYSGSVLSGGAGTRGTNYGGGGGGGGYFGGGGGNGVDFSYQVGSGGGGSGYGVGATLVAGSGRNAANMTDSSYVPGVGMGAQASGTAGGTGLVDIRYTCAAGYTNEGGVCVVTPPPGPSCSQSVSTTSSDTRTFSTIGVHSFVVPTGVTNVTVKAWGAGGGGGGASGVTGGIGGGGGFAQRTLSVTAGETLTIAVGDSGKGGKTSQLGDFAPGAGGSPGGGVGGAVACNFRVPCTSGGGGGGYSGVFRGAVSQASALIIAGGGGGSGGVGDQGSASNAGPGGGASGGAASLSGTGGTQSAGGGGWSSGSALQGGSGSGGGARSYGGGGGGGGYFGGGGGNGVDSGAQVGSGGGGSGYGVGATLIAGSGRNAANMTDSSYVPGVGMGAQATAGYSNGTSGGSGLVVITYIAAGATSTVGSCACTGATPSNSNICTGDDVELATSTPRTLVSSCSPSTKCEYTCSSGYVLQDGACVAITYSCTGSAPSNANLCGGDADGLASDTPRKLVYDCSVPSEASKCEYTCSSGFTKDGEGCVSIYPDLVAFNTSPTSATVGVSVTLSATITNQGGALAGNSFKNLFQVALGANGGGDIAITNLASATSLPLAPGTSRDIYLPHTFTSAGIYSTRVCADKSYANDPGSNNEGPYEGNNCSAWVNVEVATIDDLYPDLTALNTSPATTTRNASTTLSAVITNRGAHSTGSGFQNFFQVATAADGGGSITGLSPVFISALASGASGSISSSYIFTSTGTSSVRACADKSSATNTGSVYEGPDEDLGENNNCSLWVNVVVTDVACPAGQTRQNGTCVLICPAGQTLQNGECVIVCLAGQVLQNGSCVDDGCPAGQVLQNGSCVPDTCTLVGFCENGQYQEVVGNTSACTLRPSGRLCNDLYPDLTAINTSPTATIRNASTTLSATIVNQGGAPTGSQNFYNFFQVATAPDGGGAITGLVANSLPPLVEGSSDDISRSYIFTSTGTYSVRACADKSSATNTGSVYEGPDEDLGENNNCSLWVNVVVTDVACPAGQTRQNGECVIVCPAGQVLQNGACVCNRQPYCDAATDTQNDVDVESCTYVYGGQCNPIPCSKTAYCDANTDTFYEVDATVCAYVYGGQCNPHYPDLTALNTSPATTTRNASTTLSADITNRGGAPTGSGFYNFFQVATAADGGGAITGLSPVFISALTSGASGSISSPYTFTSAGTYSVRACADKSSATNTGSVYEGPDEDLGENNNCSLWVNVVVTDVACPAGQTRQNGTCVLICPAGQTLQNGECVIVCPAGQVLQNGACVCNRQPYCDAETYIQQEINDACQPYPSGLRCDPIYPDLTAINTSPTATIRNASTTLSATIVNQGGAPTGSQNFYNFFQVATAPDGGGAITGLVANSLPPLVEGSSDDISRSYIFTSTGTSSVRACADKSSATDTGSVREGLTATSTNENNNCSDWVNVVVRDTQSCTKQPYCDANADGVNGVQNDVDPVACAYVYGGQCNPIPECLLKRGYCEVSTNTYFAVDSDTPDCKYVKAGYCTPPECRGYIPEHAASCPGDENVTSDSGRVLVSSCTPSKKCEYYCSPGYVKQGGECVSQYSCTGATPSNTNICTGDAAGLTANTPRTVALSCGTPKCQYTCSAGYELYADGVCRFGQCPVGYRQEGTGGSLSCRFDRCPEGWTESFDQILNQTRCTPPQGCFNRCGDVNQGEDHDDIINQCQSGSRRVYQCTNGCTLGGCNGTPPPSITEWLVTPLLIRAGNQVQVRWQTANTQLCTVVSANGDSWSGTEGSGGTVLSSQTVFTITCEGLPGSSPSSVSRSSTVNILPAFQER